MANCFLYGVDMTLYMKYYSLHSLTKSIKNHLDKINKEIWVTAEIADLQDRYHYYLELVQRDEDIVVARVKAVLWNDIAEQLLKKLEKAFYEVLKVGSKVLIKITIQFHEVYGLSLVIRDLDIRYTLGELEKKKQETLEKLEKERLLKKQLELTPKLVFQRIAIISSPTAAGLEDFMDQLHSNIYGYAFSTKLYPVFVQGERAAKSIIHKINSLNYNNYDCIVILRGGGSRFELDVFNDYELSKTIALCELPVITGIGHLKDESVSDIVSFKSLKTPTAVAEWLIEKVLFFESNCKNVLDKALDMVSQKLVKEKLAISQKLNEILILSKVFISNSKKDIFDKLTQSKSLALRLVDKEKNRIDYLSKTIKTLDPKNLLEKGYTYSTIQNIPISELDSISIHEKLITISDKFKISSKIEIIDKLETDRV